MILASRLPSIMPTILGHPAVFVAVAIGINDSLLIVLCGFAAMAVAGIK